MLLGEEGGAWKQGTAPINAAQVAFLTPSLQPRRARARKLVNAHCARATYRVRVEVPPLHSVHTLHGDHSVSVQSRGHGAVLHSCASRTTPHASGFTVAIRSLRGRTGEGSGTGGGQWVVGKRAQNAIDTKPTAGGGFKYKLQVGIGGEGHTHMRPGRARVGATAAGR